MSTSLFVLAAIAYFVWRALRPRLPKLGARGASPIPTLRSDRSGDEGEARVQAELVEVLTWLCGSNFYLHSGPILLNHAPGTEFPTAEVDHLAITPFGIFIFETKNWTGLIEPGASADVLIRIGADGEPQARKSPLSQNRSKLAFLRGTLPPVWPIEGAGVFANDGCVLSPDLPVSILRRTDLAQWLRDRRARHAAGTAAVVDVAKAWAAVQRIASTDELALRKHRERRRVNPKI
ncbi:nuclease-like protein [Paraburkholderia sp. BL6669N2]|uniref:nuclease-related domain-containing protein n=1 Tax=Paraburkholderia sp. BL6669N2 TaxID=1938807 RepID=UPI000E25B151|nr:nuclease-related domain-containing protein [Paraburkholderia sp. BL6669N2]REG45416.1 nuclease-like protein [Paraburkholderia sp. BL6669N2]